LASRNFFIPWTDDFYRTRFCDKQAADSAGKTISFSPLSGSPLASLPAGGYAVDGVKPMVFSTFSLTNDHL
jgi:hypothetical protein